MSLQYKIDDILRVHGVYGSGGIADQLVTELNLVQLDEDQSLPENPHRINRDNPFYYMDTTDREFALESGYEEAQQDMKGWKKVSHKS